MRQQDETIEEAPRAAIIGLQAGYQSARNLVTQVLMPHDDRSKTQSNAVIAFAVRLASAALLYVMQIVLARWMGGTEYGIYVFVWTWVLILGGLAPLGLNIAAIRLAPEYVEHSEFGKLHGFTRASRLIAFAVGTLIATIGCLGLWAFAPYISSYYVLPGYLALICIPLFAVGDVQDGIGRGQAWMGIALVPPYVLRPLLILVFMFVAHLAGFPMVATTAAGAAILGTWIATLVQTIALENRLHATYAHTPGTRATNNSSDPDVPKYEYAHWFAISTPLLVIGGCELLLQNTDVLIISQHLSPAEVGIYFASAKTMSLIMFVHYAVGSAVANRFAALKARGDDEGLQAFVKDALNWTFWPSLAAAIVLLALGKPLLSLFGPQFAEQGYPVMFVLSVGFLIRSAVGPAEFVLNMLGEQRVCAAVLVATAVLNLILNMVLVPNFGMIGAAYATATSLSLGAFAYYIAVRQRLGLDLAIWKSFTR